MSNHLLAGSINPDTITNPVLGPNLQGAIGESGASPAWFFETLIPKLITIGFIIGLLCFSLCLSLAQFSGFLPAEINKDWKGQGEE